MTGSPTPDALAFHEALGGRYSLERELGRGGLGVVYLAHDLRLDRPVALKALRPEWAAHRDVRDRFLRAARAAARLSHPNVVPIHEVAEVGEHAFFAMSLVRGTTLADRVRDEGPLPPDEVTRVLREVAWALAYAHAEGVVHGALWPGNVLLDEASGRALVTDFGLFSSRPQAAPPTEPDPADLAFRSPEQTSGEQADARSDLYAVGAIGRFCLRGSVPATGDPQPGRTPAAAPPGLPGSPGPVRIPAELTRAIDRCLLSAPDDRFQDGAALAAALAGSAAAAREIPVPLRLYIQDLRSLAGTVPLVLLVWVLILLGMAGLVVTWDLDMVLARVLGALLVGGVAAVPLAALVRKTRKLLTSGYDVEDASRALADDVARRTEEIRFEFGKELTTVDRVLRALTWGGIIGGAVGMGFDLVFVTGWDLLATFNAVSVNTGIWSGIIGAYRNKHRRDAVGEGWLDVLEGRVGRWLFRVGGAGLRSRSLAAGAAHRPTELAIAMAADRLFDELPGHLKSGLRDLPETVRRLEADAQETRRHLEEVNELLARIGDDPERVGAEERARLRAELEARRDEARRRQTEAVSALERIRLGLLRLHAGEGVVERVTQALGTAHEISLAITELLRDRAEVKKLMIEPRLSTVP